MSAAWAAVDLNAGTAWPDEASFVALAGALAAVERCSELCPVSRYSDGRTSRADKLWGGRTGRATAVVGSGNPVSGGGETAVPGRGRRLERHGLTSAPKS